MNSKDDFKSGPKMFQKALTFIVGTYVQGGVPMLYVRIYSYVQYYIHNRTINVHYLKTSSLNFTKVYVLYV